MAQLWIRKDPQSFSDQDPGGKNVQIKTEKMQGKMVITARILHFLNVNLHKVHFLLLLNNLLCFF